MNAPDDWIKDELLQLFHTIADDFRTGAIDEGTFRERILRLAERYERSFVKRDLTAGQKDLF